MWSFHAFPSRRETVTARLVQRTRPRLTLMDRNIAPSTPPSTPPNKRRRVATPQTTRFPSFEEGPHLSPSKICELGLHVLLSPKNFDTQGEGVAAGGRVLTFDDDTKRPKLENKEEFKKTCVAIEQSADSIAVEGHSKLEVKVEDEELMEHWDRSRESMYVTAFNTAVDTVIDREGHLFSEEETNIINVYRNSPCTSP